MKYFIVADVHGFYNEMIDALVSQGFNQNDPNHCFVSLGDLLDRGPDPEKCLKFVLNLDPARRILIRGNHEDLMEEAIMRQSFLKHDVSNGTEATAMALTGMTNSTIAALEMRTCDLYNRYIRETINFYETNSYIFVHGWIPHRVYPKGFNARYYGREFMPEWREAPNSWWDDARWCNGMECWEQGILEPDKTIVCGHWHTSWGHCYLHHDGTEFGKTSKFTPFVDKGIIAADACTAYSGFCNCVVLDDEPLEESVK